VRRNKLGKTGLEVSVVGLGVIPLMEKSVEESESVIRRAIELGVNYIDTARAYTDTEDKIGRAIRGIRDKLVLATKTQYRSYEEARESIDTSLRLLRVETVDVMQFHAVDDEETLERILSNDGAYRAVAEAREAGKIRFIGLSSHNPAVALAAIKQARFDTVLARFSMTNGESAEELFPLARRMGMGTVAMKALDGGLLAIPRSAACIHSGARDVGVAQGAVRYALSRKAADCVIVGLGSVAEVDEIVPLGASDEPLTHEAAHEIAQVAKQLGRGFCLQCGYCKPLCPEEIDIPLVFKAQIYREKFGMERCTLWTPESIRKAVATCTECEKCLEACPNNVPIPQCLRHAADVVEGAVKPKGQIET